MRTCDQGDMGTGQKKVLALTLTLFQPDYAYYLLMYPPTFESTGAPA